ncbi:MAG: ribbon-helix-helix protein, CopG family [Candidatus Rokubacteria bacterium]|nr:ribbon-helix-helix protein, CopG family [Candidatus Rokubacteria bacterium]
MVRTQLYLEEAIHRRLRDLARRRRRTVSDLVRDAIVRTYGPADVDERERTLNAIVGLWRDRDDIPDSTEYVRRLRRGTRLRRLLGT